MLLSFYLALFSSVAFSAIPEDSFSTGSVTTYYADIIIDVDSSGLTSISGTTDCENLTIEDSPLLTSKKGAYWIFSISPECIFSDAIYEIHLPAGSSVNYMKLPALSRIKDSSNGLTIVGTAENQLLNLTVQYSIDSSSESLPPWWFVAIIGFIISSLIIFLKKKFSKSSSSKKGTISSNSSNDGSSFVSSSVSASSVSSSPFELRLAKYFDSLPDRQKKIITLIKDSKSGSITQAELEKITGYPKSSLSRNVDSLVRKNLIEKKQTGMSNTLCLKTGGD